MRVKHQEPTRREYSQSSDGWQKSIRHISLRGRKLARLAQAKPQTADAACGGPKANGCAGPLRAIRSNGRTWFPTAGEQPVDLDTMEGALGRTYVVLYGPTRRRP